MKGYFTLLPNIMILPQKTNENEIISSLLQEMQDDKLILVLDYLYTNTNRKGYAVFTLEKMIVDLGYKPNSNKNKTNDKFKNILRFLNNKNILKEKPINNYNPKELVVCRFNPMEQDKDNNNINFFKLYEEEKEKILDVEDVDSLNLLKLYCYLKARIYVRKDSKLIESTGGKAQSCYPSYATIHKDLNISESFIKQYIDILKDLNLIRYDNNGLYYHPSKPKSTKESVNNYVLYTDNGSWKRELKESLKWQKHSLEEEGYIFYKNNNYKNNNKKLNGKKGYLTRIFNQGKISESEYKEKILKLESKKQTIDKTINE